MNWSTGCCLIARSHGHYKVCWHSLDQPDYPETWEWHVRRVHACQRVPEERRHLRSSLALCETAVSPTQQNQVGLVTLYTRERQCGRFPARYDMIGNGLLPNGFCHVNTILDRIHCTITLWRVNDYNILFRQSPKVQHVTYLALASVPVFHAVPFQIGP